ncbi:hypothetical protein ACFY6U_40665 [Streptomyces sp. NPDC013157]|uniref:hypothetical protein n=1 Tax=Streptomyces sp. NPDC013157 TaxID=3364861 RepID=UPI0036B3F5AC
MTVQVASVSGAVVIVLVVRGLRSSTVATAAWQRGVEPGVVGDGHFGPGRKTRARVLDLHGQLSRERRRLDTDARKDRDRARADRHQHHIGGGIGPRRASEAGDGDGGDPQCQTSESQDLPA